MLKPRTELVRGSPSLTNEERRVLVYCEGGLPTNPSHVAPDTPLESLNLSWREKDLPEKKRTKHVHRLHPYLGKFIPQLVEVFLRKYFEAGQTVLDPFCGCGTTLVQASELGVNAIGYDVSAFNVLLCRAKVRKYDTRRLRGEVFDILEKLGGLTRRETRQLELWDDGPVGLQIPDTDDEYLRKWYAPRALGELLAYRHLIESEGYEYRDLLKVILSRSARSARLTRHYDLDFPRAPQTEPYWCYKHSRQCHPTEEALKFLKRYSLDTVRRIEEFQSLRSDASVNVRHADSRRARFPRIDGIVTSPPYVGLIDYHDQHAYAYHLLGLADRRSDEIGAAIGGSGGEARKRYQKDIAQVFRKAVSAMEEGGRMIVIVHDRAHLYEEIAAQCGVEVEAILHRHVNRRTGRRSSEFYECVFVWKKS